MRKALLILIVLAVLIAGCGKTIVCPDGSVAKSQADCASPQVIQTTTVEPGQAQTISGQEVVTANHDPKIQRLIDLANTKVKTVTFKYAPIEYGPSGYAGFEKGTYYVKDDKLKFNRIQPMKFDPKTYVDVIYLDLTKREARGFCSDTKYVYCKTDWEERPAEFSEFNIDLPMHWLNRIPASAKVRGPQSFNSRETTAIRYTLDGKFYEMYLDDFTGMPLRVGLYKTSEYADVIGGVEYRDPTFNNVRDSDVTPPSS